MNEDLLIAIESKKYLDDQIALSQIQQLAFGKAVSTIVSTPMAIVPTSATNIYSTSTYGVSQQPYYKKEVDDASLFMDDKLKILAASPYDATPSNNMHKLDYISAISLSSSCAITEYFNIIYYDLLRAHGSKGKYEINDTKNVIKHQHLNLLTQTFENIVQYSSAFTIEKIKYKWDNLHKALIWLILKTR